MVSIGRAQTRIDGIVYQTIQHRGDGANGLTLHFDVNGNKVDWYSGFNGQQVDIWKDRADSWRVRQSPVISGDVCPPLSVEGVIAPPIDPQSGLEEHPSAAVTQEEYRRRSHRCPVCGGHDVVGESFDVDEGQVSQNVTCQSCWAYWVDIYQIAGYANLELGEREDEL